MKNIIKNLILITVLFFIYNNTYATEGYIEKILDLNNGVEKMDIELVDIDEIYFKNSSTQYVFSEFKRANELLKQVIIEKYENGDFDYYQVKGIITNQKNFVYYTNQYFKYKKIKEQYPNEKEVDDFIMKNYSEMRISYNRVKNLVY